MKGGRQRKYDNDRGEGKGPQGDRDGAERGGWRLKTNHTKMCQYLAQWQRDGDRSSLGKRRGWRPYWELQSVTDDGVVGLDCL